MNKIKLTDEVVLPVMAKHNIDREEAEKRLQLLYQSNILQTGDPEDLETQQLIEGFLAQDSKVLAETVLFEKEFTSCIENKEFVKNYDRLSGRNLSKVLRLLNEGQEPSNAKKEFKKFEKFVRETVLERFTDNIQP
jgi:hypothetical protein